MRANVRGVMRGEPGRLVVKRGFCRGCGSAVPKGRINWCGEPCVEQYRIRHWPEHARQRVFERDRGHCAICGRNCEALAERLSRWLGAASDETFYARCELLKRLGVEFLKVGLGTMFRGKRIVRFKSLWQADHTVPVVEGGGGCDLNNLRTACTPCHKKASRALAGRRRRA